MNSVVSSCSKLDNREMSHTCWKWTRNKKSLNAFSRSKWLEWDVMGWAGEAGQVRHGIKETIIRLTTSEWWQKLDFRRFWRHLESCLWFLPDQWPLVTGGPVILLSAVENISGGRKLFAFRSFFPWTNCSNWLVWSLRVGSTQAENVTVIGKKKKNVQGSYNSVCGYPRSPRCFRTGGQ